MWHRFTKQARQVIFSAQAEAKSLGFTCVTSEHILLGLIADPSGPATQVLESLGIDIAALRAEVHNQLPRILDSLDQNMTLSQSAKQAIDWTYQECQHLRSPTIAPEHLLLGILRGDDTPSCQVLLSFGVTLAKVRRVVKALPKANLSILDRLRKLLGLAQDSTVSTDDAQAIEEPTAEWEPRNNMWQLFTERARKVVFYAQQEAEARGHEFVTTEHLLLGLLREQESLGVRILTRIGVNLTQFQTELELSLPKAERPVRRDMTLTMEAKRATDLAYAESQNLRDEHLGTEHLLLGLIRESDSLAAKLLGKNGAKLESVRSEIALLRPPPNPND